MLRLSRAVSRTAITLALLLLATGCASRSFVRTEVAAANQRIAEVESQVESNQDQIADNQTALNDQSQEIKSVSGAAEGASKTAKEALDRAIEAGRLAEGTLLFETILSEDRVRFGFDQSDLGDEAQGALASFAEQLRAHDGNLYIEIQGHTDSVGSETYNMRLGEERAEAVRRALNSNHNLPLHRLSVISYGENEPLADNGTRDGRARNRRVVLVVLK